MVKRTYLQPLTETGWGRVWIKDTPRALEVVGHDDSPEMWDEPSEQSYGPEDHRPAAAVEALN